MKAFSAYSALEYWTFAKKTADCLEADIAQANNQLRRYEIDRKSHEEQKGWGYLNVWGRAFKHEDFGRPIYLLKKTWARVTSRTIRTLLARRDADLRYFRFIV